MGSIFRVGNMECEEERDWRVGGCVGRAFRDKLGGVRAA